MHSDLPDAICPDRSHRVNAQRSQQAVDFWNYGAAIAGALSSRLRRKVVMAAMSASPRASMRVATTSYSASWIMATQNMSLHPCTFGCETP